MAEVEIFKINTDQAVKSIGDLRENIKQLKKALNDQDISNPEGMRKYNELLEELKVNQNALKDAMYATTASFKDITASATGANVAFNEQNELLTMENVSYNALVHTMANLKEAWRSTTDETERANLGERINAVNTKLKQMDASVGNYSRNVGMYSNVVDHLGNSLAKLSPAAGKVVSGVKQVDTGLKLLSTNPVVGVITMLVPLINSVASALNSTEENANKTASAFSVFAAAGDLLKNVMQLVGSAIANVISNLATLLGDIFPALQRFAEKRMAVTKEEIDLAHRQRIVIMQNAESEKRIAEWRNEAADKYKYTAQERLKLLQSAADEEAIISKRNYELAQMEYEVQKQRADLSGNDKEENDRLAQAYAKMVNAETEYFQTTTRIRSQMATARKEMAAEADAARKKEMDAITAYLTELQKIGDEIDEQVRQNGEDLVAEMEAGWKKAHELTDSRIEDIQNAAKTQMEWNDILTEDEQEQAQKRYEISQRANQQILAALKSAYETAAANGDLDGMLDYEQQIADTEVEIEMNAAEEKRRIREADTENAKEAMKQRLDITQQGMAAAGSIFSSLADIYESGTKVTKAEAEKAKNLRIASATIDMLQGVVTAISQAQELGPVAGPIMAAINSAAVIAAGVANINKIKSTKISTSSSASPAAVAAPSVNADFQQVRAITSGSEEDRLNKMAGDQRVYILQSDIEASNASSKARVAESSY